MKHVDWEERFVDENAIWKYTGGMHAAYELSDIHSDFYFNSECVQCILPQIGQALFYLVEKKLTEKPDWIVTYSPYGMEIGNYLADLFHCKFEIIDFFHSSEVRCDILTNDKVLFCADDLHSGGSFRKVKAILDKAGARLLDPLVVIANFYGASAFDNHEIVALLHKNIHTWDADNCPLCAKRSIPLCARKNWKQLAPNVSQCHQLKLNYTA